jgi:hypothetical protein
MGERGYNLVVVVILITLLNIAVAASLPLWSSSIQHDKEEELISRGLQYAEAIRIFQNRFQRLPIRLEELIEVEPRSIRRLWKDPMTDDGNWAVIFQGQPPVNLRSQGGEETAESPDQDLDDGRDDGSMAGPRKGETVATGPIIGVHSRSGKASFLTFNGKQRYDEWHFRLELLLGQGRPNNPNPNIGLGTDPGGGGLTMSSRWIGRPLPSYLSTLNQPLPDPDNPGDLSGSQGGSRRPKPPQGRRSPQ